MAVTSPSDVCNQALDLIGAKPIAEMRDGSDEANVALRHYTARVRDLLRSVHWNFARKQSQLTLVKDATGQTANVPTDVPQPWVYEYLYPDDCEKVRWVPQLSQQDNQSPPLMTNLGPLSTVSGMSPAPYVIGTDIIVPSDQASGAGVAVILTNINNALLVYTARVMSPDLWDSLFLSAVVGLLAAWFAVPCRKDDPKFALEVRAQQIAFVKELVGQARVTNGNEDFTTVDHLPDWIRVRGAGRWPFGFIGANAFGLSALSFDSLALPDGSAF